MSDGTQRPQDRIGNRRDRDLNEPGLWATWLHAAAQFGPACFVSVTGMLLATILGLRDTSQPVPYIVVTATCFMGLVAGSLTRRSTDRTIARRGAPPPPPAALRRGKSGRGTKLLR